MWCAQCHQNHWEWKESQVGFVLKARKNVKEAWNLRFISHFFGTNRKNWTSSWTVLQGSSLLFAKGQGGSTSWVCIPSGLRGFGFCKASELFQQPIHLSSFFLHSHLSLCCVILSLSLLLSFPLLPPLLCSPLPKSYYRSSSIPELLLTLLSSWKSSVKPRPAVAFVSCRPVQAAAVCLLFSACVAAPLPSFIPFFTSALTG